MRILVAYDGSKQSDQAIQEAVNLAEKFKGSITVLNVYWAEPENEKNSMLQNAEKLLMETFVKYELISEKNQSPSNRIITMARDCGFDVISIGSKGRHGAKERLLGSVVSKVIAEAPCPILVTK